MECAGRSNFRRHQFPLKRSTPFSITVDIIGNIFTVKNMNALNRVVGVVVVYRAEMLVGMGLKDCNFFSAVLHSFCSFFLPSFSF